MISKFKAWDNWSWDNLTKNLKTRLSLCFTTTTVRVWTTIQVGITVSNFSSQLVIYLQPEPISKSEDLNYSYIRFLPE